MPRISLVLLMFAVSGCTWVKVSESGQSVSVLDAQAVVDCTIVGKLTAISRARVAGINRNREKLTTELETIARNEGADMGGNVVVPLAEIEENERRFQVYQCP